MISGCLPFEEIASWRVPEPENGAGQMALDEVMLRLSPLPVLRIYRWSKHEVTFGYPQRWKEARAFAGARPITRRCTGGGLVEHGDDTTVALAVPSAHPFSRQPPAETYRQIHQAILEALLTEDLRLAKADDCRCGPACFASPAPSDVLSRGRKIVGGAQRRSRDGLLYQGSVQGVDVDENFENRLRSAFARKTSEWKPLGWARLHEEIAHARYGCEEWTLRR